VRIMRTLIFVSYFSSIEGMVMAEWADDKLRVASTKFNRTFLITSIASKIEHQENVVVFRVPSLSWRDFSWELQEIRKNDRRWPLLLILYFPLPYFLGRIWDYLFDKITDNSAARWSWAFSALPQMLILKILHPSSYVFCTGGATGGHLLGLFTKYLTHTSLYLEFQDPLLGSEMVRSSFNSSGILNMERLFISNSVRTVFVTKNAAQSAIKRHPALESRIANIYPGAWKFQIDVETKVFRGNEMIEVIHLGTLYGARNLDNFFRALDELKDVGYKNVERVRVTNFGALYLENKDDYLMRQDFRVLQPTNRQDALIRASLADALLLIQHADSRSQETIPYKTFDYFNLSKPIFAVINNPELAEMLESEFDFVSDSTSVTSIRFSLMDFLDKSRREARRVRSLERTYLIEQQFSRIFE